MNNYKCRQGQLYRQGDFPCDIILNEKQVKMIYSPDSGDIYINMINTHFIKLIQDNDNKLITDIFCI